MDICEPKLEDAASLRTWSLTQKHIRNYQGFHNLQTNNKSLSDDQGLHHGPQI